MKTFVRVVDAGSFSAAARLLHVGQPAVSKTVAQLEEEIQVRLLARSTQRLTPTEAGQRFYERAKIALEEADEAELAARGAGRALTGQLRISAAPTFARLHVIPRLPLFLAEHPELSVDLVLDDRQIDLIAEGIDVSLRMGSLTESGAVARRLGQSARSVVATPAYLARAGVPVIPGDLAGHETLLVSHPTQAWSFRRGGTEASVVVKGRVRLSAAEGIRAAVLAGIGLTIASDWMFHPELADGRVVRLLTDWSLPTIDLWAVFPTGRMASAKARAFTDFVEAGLSQPYLGAGPQGAKS